VSIRPGPTHTPNPTLSLEKDQATDALRRITVTVGIGLAVLTAAPAHADVDTATYIEFLDAHGVTYSSVPTAIDSGLTVCNAFRDGSAFSKIRSTITRFYSLDQANVIIADATTNLCPDMVPVLDSQLTG
jgi:hypothetical protein